ncbi:MAG: hypothetical protein IOC80_02250 [Rhodobacter sp.]|nr:hypothetical protein [Rhodobacter sp.]MCA3519245.1 hypothetical protein [Rhodobacter sp.]MCA3530018.1 hypothetical protein [Rhodobacter sp.]MCA3531154.1 hypothetical protein [Rhodobacter sp.]MCA3535617.1 hypothetical protein [Rhodobacter sp.]
MPELRKMLRWFHIFGGLYLGTFLFSPLIEYPSALLAARIVSVGLLLSGVSMWQWPRVTRAIRGLQGQ